jgi:ketosteroid isomerase-like protein
VSGDNICTARKVLAAVSKRDLSDLLELTDPQIEWRSFFAALTEGGEYRGHDGMRQYLADLDEAFELLRPDPGDLLGVGEIVVGVGRIHWRGKGSGIETDSLVGWIFRFRKGRVVYFRAFNDPEKSLEAVGRAE